jgi:hypothetical protein
MRSVDLHLASVVTFAVMSVDGSRVIMGSARAVAGCAGWCGREWPVSLLGHDVNVNIVAGPPTGATLGTISSGLPATNAASGGADRRTLHITAGRAGDYGIYSIRLGLPGCPC